MVDQPADVGDAEEVARDVEHHAAPGEARAVGDRRRPAARRRRRARAASARRRSGRRRPRPRSAPRRRGPRAGSPRGRAARRGRARRARGRSRERVLGGAARRRARSRARSPGRTRAGARGRSPARSFSPGRRPHARVDHRGQRRAVLVGEQDVVAGRGVERVADRVGAQPRRVDPDDQLRLGAELLDDLDDAAQPRERPDPSPGPASSRSCGRRPRITRPCSARAGRQRDAGRRRSAPRRPRPSPRRGSSPASR